MTVQTEDSFTAILYDKDEAGGVQIVDFKVELVDEDDRSHIAQGAIFEWSIQEGLCFQGGTTLSEDEFLKRITETAK